MRTKIALQSTGNPVRWVQASNRKLNVRGIMVLATILVIESMADVSNAQSEVRAIPQDVQIISDEFQNVLTEKRREFKDAAWPQDLDKVRVDKSRVPNTVMMKAGQWLRLMVKDKYLPKDPNNWFIPIRKPKPGYYKVGTDPNGTVRRTHIPEEGFDDYLIMRYSVGGNVFQIQESGAAVRLLIDVNDPGLFRSEPKQFITDALYEFLNYPTEYKGSLRFDPLEDFTYLGRTIWSDIVNCNFDIQDREARSKRTWWNHTFLWTDGKRLYLSLVEMDGHPQEPQAAMGLRPRFK
jgi:hypothetical protein